MSVVSLLIVSLVTGASNFSRRVDQYFSYSPKELVVNYIPPADKKLLDDQAKVEAELIENLFATTPDHYIADKTARKDAALFVGYRRAVLRVLMGEMSQEDQSLFEKIFQEQTRIAMDEVATRHREFTERERQHISKANV